jgi:hypothetical protein
MLRAITQNIETKGFMVYPSERSRRLLLECRQTAIVPAQA